jgi:hypothetical protein
MDSCAAAEATRTATTKSRAEATRGAIRGALRILGVKGLCRAKLWRRRGVCLCCAGIRDGKGGLLGRGFYRPSHAAKWRIGGRPIPFPSSAVSQPWRWVRRSRTWVSLGFAPRPPACVASAARYSTTKTRLLTRLKAHGVGTAERTPSRFRISVDPAATRCGRCWPDATDPGSRVLLDRVWPGRPPGETAVDR